ncbi:MAG: radical SAM family heme chaperone HemW [Spirochaetaceae bacterium]|jgi:oxygen-independent coproporphyrinogen-3 oxidase|nr:radical SAM family heme chaperone HemW [Spirochaetaceae bacterium]
MVSASLYIHIPFCAKKCDYCDFYSVPAPVWDERLMDGFVERLREDIEGQVKTFGITEIGSVYIGGGTPSLLGARRMKDILDFLTPILRGRRRETDDKSGKVKEFTVEVNPESLSEDFLRVCVDGGVTRISCGVQTFNADARGAIGRCGGVSRIGPALDLIREIFGGAFSADLISGLPFQDRAALFHDIETLLSYNPSHVSLYDLTLEENTPLYRNNVLEKMPPREPAENLWILGRDLLESRGYPQYEVSNFAPENSRSKHNIVYWRMGCWFGAGPSASGTIILDGAALDGVPSGVSSGALRRTVSADVQTYVSGGKPEVFTEALDRNTLIKESFIMGFRYIDGPDEALFKQRFGCAIEDIVPETLRKWRGGGKMRGGVRALNKDGLILLNRFLIDCFVELDKFFSNERIIF